VINSNERGHGGAMSSVPVRSVRGATDETRPAESCETTERLHVTLPPTGPDRAFLGPRRDLAALVRAEIDFVWRSLRGTGLSPADADDATQQVFLVASNRLGELVPGKERSFLYGTALRVARNVRRGLSRRREAPAELDELETIAESPGTEELVEKRRARALLGRLLAELPEELARVLWLAEVEQLTLAAIAELEDIPQGTAASRLRRAREAFRKLLERHRRENPYHGAQR
jgi:RNA polymerase sigma-70 factor (ECF subfamily)